MKEKACPKCLLDELDHWFLYHHWRGTDDEHIGMIEEAVEMLTSAIEEGIPAACLCEIHRKDRDEQMELFGKEVVQVEGAH